MAENSQFLIKIAGGNAVQWDASSVHLQNTQAPFPPLILALPFTLGNLKLVMQQSYSIDQIKSIRLVLDATYTYPA